MAAAVRTELRTTVFEAQRRGLIHTAKWAAEQLQGLPVTQDGQGDHFAADSDVLMLARSYFDLKEYRRAAHVLQNSEHEGSRAPPALFLRLYALYLAGEKHKEEKKLTSQPSARGAQQDASHLVNPELHLLLEELQQIRAVQTLDGYLLYLFAVVQRGLEMKQEALQTLSEAVNICPCNWSAWQEISALAPDIVSDTEISLGTTVVDLPDHWVTQLFQTQLMSELQHQDLTEVLGKYEQLRKMFPQSIYLRVQKAMANYLAREYDEAEEIFSHVLQLDPYRLEHIDIYSNILFVKEKDAELSNLAHNAAKWDKFRPETCCIIGNYYSRKAHHEKAVEYFSRALKLDPHYLSACTLMGHEYLEMRNASAAIESYRRAVDINPRDYRAWYGIGQAYEILSMVKYALYYYRKVVVLRPTDARMWCAMGTCYERLGSDPVRGCNWPDSAHQWLPQLLKTPAFDAPQEAIRCFERGARNDAERVALPALAKLYRRAATIQDTDRAAEVYRRILNFPEDLEDRSLACADARIFLAAYHRERGELQQASDYCTDLLDRGGAHSEEARALLRDIHSTLGQPT